MMDQLENKDNIEPLDVIFVTPKEDDKISKSSKEKKDAIPSVPFYQLFRFATFGDKIMLVIAFLSAFITGSVAPINTLVFADLTEAMIYYAISQNPDVDISGMEPINLSDAITTFSLRSVGLGVLLLVFSYLATMLSNYTAHNQIFTIRKRFMQSALNQDVSYYDLNESGDFASRMTDDLVKLEEGIGEKVTTCFHYWVSFVGCIALAFVRGWKLTFVCLSSFPITLISTTVVGIMSSRLSKEESVAYGYAGSVAEEVLSGIRTVIAFDGQKKEAIRFRENLVEAQNINIKRGLFTGIGIGILWFCIYSTYALSFWYGVGLVVGDDDNYPPATMVAVFFGVFMGLMNFGFSTPFIEIFGMAKGSGAKVFSVIDNVSTIDPLADRGEKPSSCKGNIYFKNIFFDYPSRPDVKILQGFDLAIKPGETVAVVGSSGCGKSTCIQLVQRFYDPQQGAVLLDGKDIKELSVNWLRKNIGVVGQEPVLFNTTIAENIRFGNDSATRKDIEKAAKQSNAHHFIQLLPKGYDTMVGERGTQLSGGQKQRIAIARALVRNPKILLLDEATSALDNASEHKVQMALDLASEGRTTIIVAHRLSTIRGADVIVAIDAGKVVEKGTHDELMAIKGHYFKLVTAQLPSENEKEVGLDLKRASISSIKSIDDDLHIPPEVTEDDTLVALPNMPLSKIVMLNLPEWKFVSVACFCSLVMGSAMPSFSVIFGNIIGALSNPNTDEIRDETNFYCIIFVCAGFITGIASFVSILMYGIAGERMTLRLRAETFEAMLRQEIGWFDDKANATGSLCARLSGEASAVQGATGQRIGTIIQSFATFTIALVLAIYFEWRLGLVALSFTPFTLVATYMHKTVAKAESFGSSKAMERSTKLAVDVISNIRTVASLGREALFLQEFAAELIPAMKRAKINTHYRGLVYGIARSLMFFAFAASIYYGGYLIENEGVFYADVLKVSQVLVMATLSIANALTFAPNLQKGMSSASRIMYLLNRIPKIVDPPNKVPQNFDAEGKVKYMDVSFSYPTRPYVKVLNNLGLTIPAGKTVALVGASGCGKSTCIQLLERFYDPNHGTVFLDNEPANELTMYDLRRNLGIVSQEPILFDRTIGENIAYGDNSRVPSEQEIIDAAKQANIHNFITKLPMGYNTRLGTKGAQLSGGQKQRVAIARALLRNPKILLLDEATSALDTESEKVVQEALDKAKLGRTCITIAHRLSTIKDSDLICVFNEGKVAESGTHAQLVERRGIYFRLLNQKNA